jgi:formylglycine-generating enzyme required for sulfatase activity
VPRRDRAQVEASLRSLTVAVFGVWSVVGPSCTIFDRTAPPPLGEALVVVDTDLPVPRVVSRLRVDVMSDRAEPIESRDDVLPDARDWPVSFSVYVDEAARERDVLVRLRAYPDARVIAGSARDPDRRLTVDRVVRLHLVYGVRGRAVVKLSGSCVGVPARISGGDAASCVGDGETELVAATAMPLDADLAREVPSAVGTFGSEPCEAPPREGAVCVPGGAFIMGDAFFRPRDPTSGRAAQPRPERTVSLSRFEMDRDEVSVARFRATLARGLVPPVAVGVTERDGAVGDDATNACTFSAQPRGREDAPLSCVTWTTARALCRFDGGDLPSEAQWEYAALAAARAAKATYPWGEAAPTCERAVFARGAFSNGCVASGVGPAAAAASDGDVSAAGVRGMAGSLSELVRDNLAAYDDPCWAAAPSRDPSCELPRPPGCPDPETIDCRSSPAFSVAVRGGSWVDGDDRLRPIARERSVHVSTNRNNPTVGFRCVYPPR